MTSISDLVERLRALADCDARSGEPLGKCMREAADALTAETKRADEQVEALTKAMENAEKNHFNLGYTMAVANLINLHDQPGMAADVMAQCDITMRDIKLMDLTDYDMKPLRKMYREEPVLRGGNGPSRRARALLNKGETDRFAEPWALVVSQAAFDRFLEACENPKRPTDKLIELMRMHEPDDASTSQPRKTDR